MLAFDDVSVKEAVMLYHGAERRLATFCMTAGVILLSVAFLRAQDAAKVVRPVPRLSASSSVSAEDLRALIDSVRELQDHVKELNMQVSELRGELDATRSRLAARVAIDSN